MSEQFQWEPAPRDIQFIRDLILSGKDVWGIPGGGSPDRPETYLQYYIHRPGQCFKLMWKGLHDPHNVHEKNKIILAKIGWTMKEPPVLTLDPIPPFIMQLVVSGQPPEIANELAVVLKGHIDWKFNGPMDLEEYSRFWQARVGDWQLVLADFFVGSQPGREPGDRGQSIALSNPKRGLALMSDALLFHYVAMWLLQRMQEQPTFGVGKTDVAGQTLKEKYGSSDKPEKP